MPCIPPHSPKKLKMSSSSATEDAASSAPGEPRRRYERRMVAIFLGYCGAGYQGMQKNPGARTIEGDLEEALFLAGAVPAADRGLSRRYEWARSARTDKGVSAAAQVVSGRFCFDPPGFVARLNVHLPDQIAVFGFKRVTDSFSAKNLCDRRRYVYLLPVFSLDPSAHPDRESVTESIGSDNELTRCLECSERGRKRRASQGSKQEERPVSQQVASLKNGAVKIEDGKFESVKLEKPDIASVGASDHQLLVVKLETADSVSIQGAIDPETITELRASNVDESGNSSNIDFFSEEKSTVETVVHEESNEQPRAKTKFCYDDEHKARFNRILQQYVGTHDFCNFTNRRAEVPSTRRYIISFHANTVVCIDGIEFVKCEVVGQSFMLHQIRKMIGLAVAVMRNCAPESIIGVALKKDVGVKVPTAPEVGLYLDECLFTSYNKQWKDSHEPLTMDAYAEEAEDFKMKYIHTHIAAMEHKEGTFALWLHSLNHRNYQDLCAISNCAVPHGKHDDDEDERYYPF
ncbi:tRNA pseudouridine synthase A-like [Zingiber officinale]|nr:tRNA pseudouridine synthase A-like [Zingiber officinale]